MLGNISTVLIPATITFLIGILITPFLTHYLYKYKAWKKRSGKVGLNGLPAEVFNKIHEVIDVRAPRMGGIVIWASVLFTTVGIAALALALPHGNYFESINFLTRNQTWIPLATLIIGSLAGLVDDLLVIRPCAEGLQLRYRLAIVILLSGFIGWWFYQKLGVTAVGIPFGSPWEIGALIIPLFILISLAVYASGVIDGIDGLSGGVFASIFASYAIIAYTESQTDLAAFCASVAGGLLAFLWFNVPPARFYMTDTGTMGLTLTVATVAFMTDNLGGGIGIAVLPIIGFLLVVTVASDILQLFWKKVFKKKLFRIAPLHHHFEAIGWSGPKVVMRYWILSIMFAFAGVILAIGSLHA